MKLDVISYFDLYGNNKTAIEYLKIALFHKGIVGVRGIPGFENISRAYLEAAQRFTSLHDSVKQQYAPDRDSGDTDGYELSAEWFKNTAGVWQIDDKKSSYYAYVPDRATNKWPREVDLRTPYLVLGQLIFDIGKLLLNVLNLNKSMGLKHENLVGYGRMLHYHKESDAANENPDWCGAHLDHGVFTGLLPGRYFCNGIEIDEPEEAGLYIVPSDGNRYEKIHAPNKNMLLFQVGEFGQLASNDGIQATKHMVRKAKGEIERFTFALFFILQNTIIKSHSKLIEDERYKSHQLLDGSISYVDWHRASFERYRAKKLD